MARQVTVAAWLVPTSTCFGDEAEKHAAATGPSSVTAGRGARQHQAADGPGEHSGQLEPGSGAGRRPRQRPGANGTDADQRHQRPADDGPAADAVDAVDAAGAVLRPNAAFARLAQAASKSDAAKGRLSIFDLVAERDRAALSASIEAAAQGKGEIAPLDVSLEGAGPQRSARLFVSATASC